MKNLSNKKIILTGPPGSGKTSVLKLLSKEGLSVIVEPARQIISEQRSIDGDGVYDRNPYLFKELMLSRMIYDYKLHDDSEFHVIFDRGIPDIIAYSDCFNIPRGAEMKAADVFRYHETIFFLPAWREIYVNDEDRLISFEEAEIFGKKLSTIYDTLDYKVVTVPYMSEIERCGFILEYLSNVITI